MEFAGDYGTNAGSVALANGLRDEWAVYDANRVSNKDEVIPEKERFDLGVGVYNPLMEECKELGLRVSHITARTIAVGLHDGHLTHRQLIQLTHDLANRLHDEISTQLFLYVPPRSAVLYTSPLDGWGEVVKRFPLVQSEIEEAAKCLALGRATASVFHQMRVMEAGLKAVAWTLGIPYSPSWESYLREINKRIEVKHRQKGIQWKRDERFFAEVASHLGIVRVAWRNPTMHIERSYTPEEAGDVDQATKGFMAHLSKRLSEKPQKRKRRTKPIASSSGG